MPEGFSVTISGGRTIWIDDFECRGCGAYFEIMLRRDEEVRPCPDCGSELQVVITKPKDWEMKVTKSDSRIIWSEKQIEASHGKNWRETSKRPLREGGCGGRQFYDCGARSEYRPVRADG
jgi:putative FmdB family regulatory protein